MRNSLSIVLSCACCLAASAETEVYRLERIDGQTHVVGVDGVRRPVVLVDPNDWAAVTNNVFREIGRLSMTESGRVKLHGPLKHQIVNEKEREVANVYEDGYIHVERMRNRTRPEVAERRSAPEENEKRKHYSRKYVEMLKERAKAARPKSVTVEHDATTGKDTVK